MPGGSNSRVLSRIQDHNKSPGRARSSCGVDEERTQSEPSSNKRKKSSRSLSSNQKSMEKRGRNSGRSPSRASEVAFSFKFTSSSGTISEREWAKSLLLAQKASYGRLEKLEKVVEHQGQKSTDDSLSGQKFEKKLYEKVLRHLQNVASFDSSVPVGRDEIEAGLSLIKERDKFLVLDGLLWVGCHFMLC